MASPGSARALQPSLSITRRQCLFLKGARRFSTTSPARADNIPSTSENMASLASLSREMRQSTTRRNTASTNNTDSKSSNPFTDILNAPQSLYTEQAERNFGLFQEERKPHRLHVYAHKHNTHITLVQPPKSAAETVTSRLAGSRTSATEQKKIVDVLLSLSAGNIGFRKSGRGSYDAAFQLAGFTLKQMQEKGMWRDIHKLEVVLRGFGAGREAVTKALLGTEGRNVRNKITAVVDATRLKQGGARSKKPKRLG